VKDFFNLYRHGFARVAVATPIVRVGDPRHNGEATLELIRRAAAEKTTLVVFPELGLTAYTCEDLFHQQALIEAAEEALARLLEGTRNLAIAALVGLLGLANTMVTSVLQRFREIGILQAVGSSTREIRRMVVTEALALTSAAFVLSVGLGFVLSRLLLRGDVVPAGLDGAHVFPWAAVPILASLAAVIALGASIAPSRRATRLTPVEALRYE
jgi:hypothetical protein